MTCLPHPGRVDCSLCYGRQPITFDQTRRTDGDWRITANPLAWGNPNAEVILLGFSKGPSQAGALAGTPHELIAFKGRRLEVGKILAHVGLIPKQEPEGLKRMVDKLIGDKTGRFHFGSLIRCTVERRDRRTGEWKGSGGGMLDRFVATPFGQEVAGRCAMRFLGFLPATTKLVIMFGLGTRGNYVREVLKLVQRARPGQWRQVNEVSHTDGRVTLVHVEHFAAQGALLPNWLGETGHPRSQLGILAREGVQHALGCQTHAYA
ncbi:hypothetical protein [Rhodoligotrophos ferricapiens]|uniref:hypothetical protein n=1 Tax=Rhodoligotrophos ferricapiens TaxID=3069264 RepID=UPI00315D852B